MATPAPTAGMTFGPTPTDAPDVVAVKRHPLATRSGIATLVEILTADQTWSACTAPQRRLVSELCEPIMPALIERGVLTDDQLPLLPLAIHVGMRAALVRRRLVDDTTDRLTGKAVHAYYWQVWIRKEAK